MSTLSYIRFIQLSMTVCQSTDRMLWKFRLLVGVVWVIVVFYSKLIWNKMSNVQIKW